MNDTQLHCHTHGSNLRMLDCIVKTKDLIDYAVELGMKAVAITDHASISEHINAIQYSKELKGKGVDIKVLLGDEIYLVDDVIDIKENYVPRQTQFYHFILIAKDRIGYDQLREINAVGWQSSFFTGKMRRVPNDKHQIEKIIGNNKGHLLASTACIGGELAKSFFNKDKQQLVSFVNWCVLTFGKENFAVEIQPSDNPEQISFNKWAKDYAWRHGLKCISTCDVHYLKKEHHDIHKAFLTSREADRGESEDFYATTYMMSTEEKRGYMPYFSDEDYEQIVNDGWEFVKDVEFIDMEHITIIPERSLKGLDCQVRHIFKDWYDKYPYIKNFAYSKDNQDTYFLRMVEDGFISKKQEFNDTNIRRIAWELEQLWLISDKLGARMSAYYNLVDYIVDICWEIGFIGVSRGSVTGYYTAYLIDTQQMNPLQWNLPAYRHLNAERVSWPDVDLDSSARNRPKIIQRLKEVFGEDNILNICTFKTETSKSALKTACRGLGLSNDEASYLSSLVPVERGKQWPLKDCFYGNKEKDRKPVGELVKEIKLQSEANDVDLEQCALMIEGLISGLSLHASGIYIFKDGYLKQNSLMKTPRGDDVTCWDMPCSDYAGGLKYDSLTTECQDKLEVCTELLLKYGKIKWQGSIRATYNQYLHPDKLDYTTKEMWDDCSDGKITDLFQFITPVGGKCIRKIQPHSLGEMANANSLMRITVEDDIQPVDKFLAYKQDRSLWYKELDQYGVTNPDEIKALEKVLNYCYGCPSMQEDVMELCMEPKIAGFSLADADKARKIIAKKKSEDVAGLKEKFYSSVESHDNSINVANYVWEQCIKPQLAYSFSRNHVMPYSVEALQEMNLFYHYPPVYWNCATMIVNAGLANSTTDNEEDTSSKTTDYGKIAKSIYRAKDGGVIVKAPSINDSELIFSPHEQDNSILFGLGAISGINNDIVSQILSNRPYTSFTDFYNKNAYKGSLITKSKFIQLIKAGCFDEFEPDRRIVMRQYFILSTPNVTSLAMNNIGQIKAAKVPIPKSIIGPYNFRKYVCNKQFKYGNHPKFKSKTLYWLDQKALNYFENHCKNSMVEGVDYWFEDDRWVIVDKSLEKLLTPSMKTLKDYINTPEFLDKFNKARAKQSMIESVDGLDVNRWAFSSISFYPDEHELAHIDRERYNISLFNELLEEPKFITKSYGKREWKQFALAQIACTVIDKNDNHHMLTVLDIGNNVIQCKFNAEVYSFYKAQLSETDGSGNKIVMDKPWFRRGQTLILAGVRMGVDDFRVKSYKNSIYNHKVLRIDSINNETGEVEITSYRYGQNPED
jgi:DNA polymerase III subunit alpha